MNNGIAGLIDHSLLKPDATLADIERLCLEAKSYGFYGVCIAPQFVKDVKGFLQGSPVRVVTVIGFPLGATLTEVKVYEAMNVMGADELDIVINISKAKEGKWHDVRKDLSDIISSTKGLIHKAIIECCYLNKKEKIKAVEVSLEAGAGLIKTSTGFGVGGATINDIKLIKEIVGNKAGIKAAGGIKTLSQVKEMIEAGATRIGTSNGVEIMREAD